MTAKSADGCCTKWRFVAVVGSGGGLVGVAKGVAEEVYGVTLEAESDVCVHGSGYTDVGVAEEFLDDDEFDALFQEEGGRRVTEVVEADAAEPGPAEQCSEVAGEGSSLDRGAVRSGSDDLTLSDEMLDSWNDIDDQADEPGATHMMSSLLACADAPERLSGHRGAACRPPPSLGIFPGRRTPLASRYGCAGRRLRRSHGRAPQRWAPATLAR
ncbi:hypothetical protein GCM10010495_77010 [Kitasatospora herbaricolor]|nr:hypothetical protein GCM10010495_77010 [Kitasatospora herbaricolor]